ncbi:MAG: B12-binding domain-containing radical SAM protein, partial [Candidatus Hecatellaceae archaeon]
VHVHGALEAAKACKEANPNIRVVLGGLTATRFDYEILEKHPEVDVVVRGEGEKAFLKLLETWEKGGNLEEVPNITFRDGDGRIRRTPLAEPAETLDEFEFAELDLLEDKDFEWMARLASWSLPVCRGCIYNCVACGGSAYSYRLLMGREKPAFRSPSRLVEDIVKLREQGIKRIFLFQDPRMGGGAYWRSLAKELKRQHVDVEALTLELFQPASSEFIGEFAASGLNMLMTISPESGSERVRKAHGRHYSNQQLLDTLKACNRHHVPLGFFFMIGLAEETRETIDESLVLARKIVELQEDYPTPLLSWGCMLLLDPGSLAFENPEKFGYKLLYRSLEDYYGALLSPSWKDYVSYETKHLNREQIVNLYLYTMEKLSQIFLEAKSSSWVRAKLVEMRMERYLLEELDRIMACEWEEREDRLFHLLRAVNIYRQPISKGLSPAYKFALKLSRLSDPYGYKRKLEEIVKSAMEA